MLMPSLPPALNPWMMRPRAGQRNSGSVPAASACAPVSGAFDCDPADSRLPVGVLSIAGFLASDDLVGSAFSDRCALGFFSVLRRGLLRLLGGFVGFGGSLVLLFFLVLGFLAQLGGLGVGDVRCRASSPPSPFQCWRPRGRRRDRRAPRGASRPSPQRRSKGRWRREARRPARRNGPRSYPASRHWRRRSASRRRRSNPRPIRQPPAASRGKRFASPRSGRGLRERRRRHAMRRRGVVVLLAKGLENGLSLCEKRVTSDEHPDRKRRPKPASARRGNARPFVPATQSLIGFHPRPRHATAH